MGCEVRSEHGADDLIDGIVLWVRSIAGIDPDTLDPGALSLGVRRRMRSLGLIDPAEYARVIQAPPSDPSPPEFELLLDEFGLGETWFFRDAEPFRSIAQYAHRRGRRHQPLRVLSVPCATGEEPYSVAMTLIDAGLDTSSFVIDGVDLRRQALEFARRASFGEGSFRGMEPSAKDRDFIAVEDRFVLRPEVAAGVRFHHGNLLDLNRVLWDQPPYDLILCRNVLIYLDGATRSRVVANVLKFLADDGILITGHAEMRLWSEHLEPMDPPGSFALRRARGTVRDPGLSRAREATRPTIVKSRPTPGPGRSVDKRCARPWLAAATGQESDVLLSTNFATAVSGVAVATDSQRARELADAGQFDAATRLCNEQLEQDPDQAEAYLLLGLIARAEQRDSEAERHLDRALYLDPDNTEALLQRALLQQRAGNQQGAERTRSRLDRVRARKASGA